MSTGRNDTKEALQ